MEIIGKFTVGPLEVKRIRFVSDNDINYIFSKSPNPGHNATIWASKKCHLSLGEFENNGVTQKDVFEQIDVNYKVKEACIAIFNNNYETSTYEIKVSNEVKTPTETPSPTKKRSGGGCSKDNFIGEPRSSSINLGNIMIQKVYLGLSSHIVYNLDFLINFMRRCRSIFGHIIPPPDYIHSAIWVGESDSNDDCLGAIFNYGKYYSPSFDPSYLYKDGAQSYIMTLGEFKKRYNSANTFKLTPQRRICLFDFINELKSLGKWTAKDYNWPNNNCQHFTSKCINILHATRYSPTNNDWIYLPKLILKSLKLNEKKK